MAVLVPLIPLLLAEGACRLRGFGGHAPVLGELGPFEGRTYVTTVPQGIDSFFFSNLSASGSMLKQFFTATQEQDTVRIFMLGGSAMKGFPQPRHLTSSAFLQAMLSDLWPERNVEVINLGTTAIASFPVMCVAKEALRYDPDLLIIYSGNNEYYGAGGVASVHRFGSSTRAMHLLRQLRRLALVQWLLERKVRRAHDPDDDRTLMELVIGDAQIPFDDPRRQTATSNLENNLTQIIQACNAQGVPAIVCTLPGNELDLAPIGEDLEVPLPPGERNRFAELLERGRQNMADDPQGALPDLQAAAALYDHHATLAYLTGQCLHALGRDEEATRAFIQAKDLDTMPWRAPSDSNRAVVRAAAKGAVLCDLEQAFRDATPGGAPGWGLMDDHVHPTQRGQALIAQTLLHSMDKLADPVHVAPEAVADLPARWVYAQRLGANRLDRHRTAHVLNAVLGGAFFHRSNPKAVHRSEALLANLEAKLSPLEKRTIQRLQEAGVRIPITGAVGETLLDVGEYQAAADLLAIARREVVRYSTWYLRYTWGLLTAREQAGMPRTADNLALAHEIVKTGSVVEQLVRSSPGRTQAYLGAAHHLLGEDDQALPRLRRAWREGRPAAKQVALAPLFDILVRQNQRSEAARILSGPYPTPELRSLSAQLRVRLQSSPETGLDD
ncbi:MAG: hypothetical protein GY842_21745 [bacterium]|nr:hypothetical protein [bacterium]